MRLLLLWLVLFLPAFSQGSNFLSTSTIGVSSGLLVPMFRLNEVYKRVSVYQASISLPYYNDYFDMSASLRYAFLHTQDDSIGISHLGGAAGIQWKYWRLRVGSQAELYFFRTSENQTSKALMMDDNESEFGWGQYIGFQICQIKRVKLYSYAYWDIIWTQPEYSHLFRIQFGAQWQ